MAALQASVTAATSSRDAKSKPVSVAEAKEKRAAKDAKGKAAAKKDEEREERPARRRKSA
jgi:hypothetical protein